MAGRGDRVYEGLEADNAKTYWNENKTVDDKRVLGE